MPANSTNPRHDYLTPIWRKMRDVVGGEEKVKDAGPLYLPQPSEWDPKDYDAYKKRASFFSATGRTLDGLSGAITRKPTKVEFPKADEDLLKHVGRAGESFAQMSGASIREELTTGRLGLLVDAPPEQEGVPDQGPAYVVQYCAEDIINWRQQVVKGRKRTTLVVLREEYHEPDPKDPYVLKCKPQWRCLHLGTVAAYGEGEALLPTFSERDVSEPFYYQEVWREKQDEQHGNKRDLYLHERITPRTMGGKLLREIPFAFANPTDGDPDPKEPPLLDLANVNLSHYRTSADLEHGRHFTALPTPWFAGFKFAGPVRIGAGVCHVTEEVQAKAGMLEFTGAGLDKLQQALVEKERQMATLGSRLLESQKPGVEAAETVRLRTAGEQSALTLISNTLSEAWTAALRWLWAWGRAAADAADKIVVTFNTDFGLAGVDPATMTGWMQAVQGGLLSFDTWFYNMQRAEVIPADVTIEEERERIAAGLPSGMGLVLSGPGSALDGGQGGKDASQDDEDPEEDPEGAKGEKDPQSGDPAPKAKNKA